MKLTKASLIMSMMVCWPLFQLHAQYLGGDGDGYASAASSESTLGAPAPPVFASPPNKEAGVPTNPTLIWNASSGATSYRLLVSTSVLFSTTVFDQSGITETEFGVSGLANDTTYFWRVNATGEGGASDWLGTWQFTTIVAAPASPRLGAPIDSTTGVTTNPTLVWFPFGGAISYRLQVSTTSDFSTTEVDQSEIPNNYYEISGLSNNTDYFWRVNATNEGGIGDWSTVWRFMTELVTSVERISSDIPDDFKLRQNYPNPFNPTTTITFELPKTGFVTLKVHNALGEEVVMLVSESLQTGKYSVDLNANSLASGVYFYRLQSGSFVQTKKMLLVR